MLAKVFERHNSPMLLIDPDDGHIMDANLAALRFYGYSEGQIRQLPISQINILSEDETKAEMNRAAAEVRNYFLFQHRLADGSIRNVEVHSSPVEIDGRNLLFSIIYDITERKKIEAALARSEAISASMLQAIPVPVFYKDAEGRYLGCNDAFARLTGVPREKIAGCSVFEIWPDELASIYQQHDQQLISSQDPVQVYETQLKDEHGNLREVLFHKAQLLDHHNEVIGLIGVILDITERKRSEEQTRQLAFHDPLTNLPNRRLIIKRLRHALRHGEDTGLQGALLFLDLDNFKPLNDEHGHDAGDRLLVEVAQRLRQSVRANDSVGRLAGDEFVVILESLSADRAQRASEQAQQIAEKIRLSLAEDYDFGTFRHQCSVSIGIVLFHGLEVEEHQLFKQADQAMYQAKSSGRNRVCLYQEG